MSINQDGVHNPNNLPQVISTFIGRTVEINEINRMLNDASCRLLTLIGPGGIGKTRLAIEIAQQKVDEYSDGVFWVDLNLVDSSDLLASTIAETLSLPGQDNLEQKVLDYLKHKQVFLVLDNFEQLTDGADLLSKIIRYAPDTKLLVTSQAGLQLQEEWLYPLAGLPYPPRSLCDLEWEEAEKFDAVKLFEERVRQVRPNLTIKNEGTDLIQVCRLVEGMPLALELAATWARSMDCATIAAEIERNLTFLSTTLRNVSQRHRSMQAVFNHAWQLLDPEEKEVYMKLAVFMGGFCREAADKIADASLETLTSLADKSLLRWDPNGRYSMVEMLRRFADSKLNNDVETAYQIHNQHAKYFLAFVNRRKNAIFGAGQVQAAKEITEDLENIRSAWIWAANQQMIKDIGKAVDTLAMYFQIKGKYLEAFNLFEEVRDKTHFETLEEKEVLAAITAECGWMEIRFGRFKKAEEFFKQSQNIYEELGIPPRSGTGTDPLLGLSMLATIRGDYEIGEEMAQQALERAISEGDLNNQEAEYFQLASIAYSRGNYEDALKYAQSAHDACMRTGDEWFMAYSLNELGKAAQALGEYSQAQVHFETSYQLREMFNDPEGMALAQLHLGKIALEQQRSEDARELFQHSASLYQKILDKGGLASAHLGLGQTAVLEGNLKTGKDHYYEALVIAAEIQFTPLLLSVLADVGQFMLRTDRPDLGITLLRLVEKHPAAELTTRNLVQTYLEKSQSEFPLSKSNDRYPSEGLEDLVVKARTELMAVVPATSHRKPVSARSSTTLVEPLTERELEVLDLIAQGMTNREIAARLHVVIGTVKAHNNNIYGKLGVSNRVTAITRGRELGLID